MSDERKGLTGSLLRGLTRNTVEALAMKMGLKPNERGWVTLDIGASLLSVSPKVAMDFSSPCRRSLNSWTTAICARGPRWDARSRSTAPKRRAISSASRTKFWRLCPRKPAAAADRALLETDRAFARCGAGHLPQRAAHGRLARRRAFRLASVQNRGRSRAPLGQTQHRSS